MIILSRFFYHSEFVLLGCCIFHSNIFSHVAGRDYNVFQSAQPFCVVGSYPINDWKATKESLRDSAINKSWSYCLNCKLLSREKLLPSFDTSKLNIVKYCPCTIQRYHILRKFQIPSCFQGLTRFEILALRLLMALKVMCNVQLLLQKVIILY